MITLLTLNILLSFGQFMTIEIPMKDDATCEREMNVINQAPQFFVHPPSGSAARVQALCSHLRDYGKDW